MKEKTVTIYKNEGETPLEALNRLRLEQPIYKDATLSYAGRLDPMAEGALLVLVDEENKEREKYLGLDKVYEVEVLFGIETDTGDILGIPSSPGGRTEGDGSAQVELSKILSLLVGSFSHPYPHYSSKTVSGKPLFEWAREGRLHEIEIPERKSEIYSIDLLGEFKMTGKEILNQAKERIAKVKGDFRQEEIIKAWEKVLENHAATEFRLIKISVSCSSGTYMRTLAEEIAKKSGTVGLAWRICRKKYGILAG